MANGPTKLTKCPTLEEFLDRSMLELHIEQLVIRGAFVGDETIHRTDGLGRDEDDGSLSHCSSRHLCEPQGGECEKKKGGEKVRESRL